jgi:DIE2/ALG10 family
VSGRHYTFYLWKDVLGRASALRRWLAPVYVVAAAAIWRQLRAAQPALWCAAWAACTATVLIPAALLEFRWGPWEPLELARWPSILFRSGVPRLGSAPTEVPSSI